MGRDRGRRGGFTLLELVVVITLFGTVASLSLPYVSAMRARQDLRRVALQLAQHLADARALAQSGRTGLEGFSTGQRVVQGGLRLAGPRSYVVFGDADDRSDGQGEAVVETVEAATRYTLSANAEEVRFKRNGTLSQRTSVLFQVEDSASGHAFVVSVTYGGRVRVEPRG